MLTESAKDLLWKKYIEDTNCGYEPAIKANCANPIPSTKESSKKLREIFNDRWEQQGKRVYLFKKAWDKRGYFNRQRFYEVLYYMNAPWNRFKN